MNSRRSYLDTLNAGRHRRPGTTLDDITQSLQNLESRLEDSREALAGYGRPRGQEPRMQPRDRTWHEPAHRAAAEPAHRSLAREIDRVREQEAGLASASHIAGELRGLRDDLRQQVTGNIQREFEALRSEIGRTLASEQKSDIGADLGAEIERISQGMRDLSARTDDRGLNLLRSDIEQVKGALEQLAREETLRGVDSRWDDFDRRFSSFEKKVSARPQHDPEIAGLAQRLQSIGDAVSNLPESLSLRSLEDKVRGLAGAVEQFVRQQEHQAPETMRLLDERLDEISRAIVASAAAAAQAPSIDPALLERIEARVSGLARQIEEVVEDRPGAEVIDRLGELSKRVDDLAARGAIPAQAVERLGKQILAIAEKIDSTPLPPDADQILQGFESRFGELTSMFDRRHHDSMDHATNMFRDLERRLDQVAERIDQRGAETLDHARSMRAIDHRFAALAEDIAAQRADGSTQEAIRGLEGRLNEISHRIDASAKRFAGIDPELIRSLESQVVALSGHLNRPMGPLPELEDISPRLEELEKAVAGSRDSIVEAARQAAENAVRSLDGTQSHTAAVEGLAQDLKALEQIARRSDDRNAKTFEAIHDTLIKIVDRLGTLDDNAAAARQLADQPRHPMRKRALTDTPPLAMEEPMPVPQPAQTVQPSRPPHAPTRTPAEAAAEAAVAAVEEPLEELPGEPPKRHASLLGGLVRALKKDKEQPAERVEPEQRAPAPAPVEPSLDAPLDPKIANRPLEPGSGAPDLNAIMRRVREERGQTPQASAAGPDAAKSDFIAAARRAAQAAAAEAELLKKKSVTATGVSATSKLGGMLKLRRRPVLLAATGLLVVLAAAQLGRAYFGGGDAPAEAVAMTETAGVPPAVGAGAMPENATDDAPASVTAEAAAPVEIAAEPMPDPDPAGTAAVTAGPDSAMPAEAGMPADIAMPAVAAPSPALPVTADAAPADGPTTAALGADEEGPDTPLPGSAVAEVEKVPENAGPLALREAAEAGDAKALFELGSRYSEGRGVKADLTEAAKWYEKSAELGFAPAQYRVASFYEKATGVERDIAKAKTWYQLSAEQGNASAMHNLAVLYAMGADGTTDNESAARWFKMAADFGVKDSQFNLGILAAKGVGMPQSLEESYKWFGVVAKSGDRDAAAKRDEVANSLRPEQLTKARAAVDMWKAQPLDPEANSVEIPESWQEGPATTAGIDMKKAIGNIQRILNKNGYDAGGADGVMGGRTKSAIMAFQKDNKMEPTGEVDEQLVKALIARK
ncbi:MAG: SEL1-like repeat protein [Rhizobiaceae bacterium]|nr:SEL1-like repeat protein [Rhizobiaceae bacterium]